MSTRHWEKVPLSEIAEVRLGRQRSPKRATGPNMRPYMRAANVTWHGISLHDVKEMDFTPEEFKTYTLQRGDLLLSEASGSASEVGKPAIWNDDVPDCCFQNTLIRVRAPEPLVPFLHLHFYKDALTGEFARATRGVGIHHLGARTLNDWEIHLPPPHEQRHIVETVNSYFTRLDDVTATLKRVQQNLKRYRASILKAAVEGRLVPTEAALASAEGRDYEPATVLLERILAERRQRWEEAELEKMKIAGRTSKSDKWKARYSEPAPPDTTTLPALPEGWCRARIGVISDVQLGRQRSPKRAVGPNMRPYMRAANVTWSGINLHDVKEMDFTPEEFETYALRRGDLLLSEASGSASEVGKPAIWNDEVADCCFQNTLIRVRAPEVLVPFLYLHFYKDALTGALARATRGVGIHHLGAKALSDWEIHLPPLAEQRRIVETVDSYFTRLDHVPATLERVERNLKGYRASILKAAFAG